MKEDSNTSLKNKAKLTPIDEMSQWFSQLLLEQVQDEYSLASPYISPYQRVTLIHKRCGKSWEITPTYFLKGHRCPTCHTKALKNTEWFKSRVKELVGDEYEVLGDYRQSRLKTAMKHSLCGHIWEISPNSFLNRTRCPRCSKTARLTTEQFIARVHAMAGDTYEVVSPYRGATQKTRFRHLTCGHEWETAPTNFIRGTRCPKCARQKGAYNRKTPQQFNQEIKRLTQGEYVVKGDYVNSSTKVLMNHVTCGHEWFVNPNNFLRGTRCPQCARSNSESN